MAAPQLTASIALCDEVINERWRQLKKWGRQHHPDGTGGEADQVNAHWYRQQCDYAFTSGHGRWTDILLEEVYEALAETERVPLRTELLQVAAVCLAWVEDIDARSGDRAAQLTPERELVDA